MKSNLAIVSVSLPFAVSSFAAPAPSGVKHHALPSDTGAIALFPIPFLSHLEEWPIIGNRARQ
jgi:hypothetical protein